MAAPPSVDVPTADEPRTDRAVRPRRSLPGGRAVVGAFLVVAAAVGTFAAYLSATGEPATSYAVATTSLRPGQVLPDDVNAVVRLEAIELPEELAARAYDAGSAGALAGSLVLSALEPGDLVLRSAIAGDRGAAGVSLSFALAPERALGGNVRVGETVDLLATFGQVTRVVARDVRIASTGGADGIGGAGLVLTVLVPDLATAEAVLSAADNGELALVRGADPAERAGPGTTAEGVEEGAQPASTPSGLPGGGQDGAAAEDAAAADDAEGAEDAAAADGAGGG